MVLSYFPSTIGGLIFHHAGRYERKGKRGALYDGFFDPLFETFSLFSVLIFPFASLELRAVVDSFTQDEKQDFFLFLPGEKEMGGRFGVDKWRKSAELGGRE